MCTWAVNSVIEYFNNRGSNVFTASMDMSKAFDNVSWSKLFSTLERRSVDSVFLRLLLFIYKHQECVVKWNGATSSKFSVSNGVRQGGVSSGILFSVYIDDIMKKLRHNRIGCAIGGYFYGVFIFADDIILLSASRNGLQSMVNTCSKFAGSLNLSFGTDPDVKKSKTKCIMFYASKRKKFEPLKIVLDRNDLPWVDSVKHLGCTLQNDNFISLDILDKRRKFNGVVNSLFQEFSYASKDVRKIFLLYLQCHSMAHSYGTYTPKKLVNCSHHGTS